MNTDIGVQFHNRFDIKVIRSGKVVQKGQAENILLDSIYGRLCNLDTFFEYIHFGTGSGTPSPERKSLFSFLGSKSAVLEEQIMALPTSKQVKRITIMPEEYVGETITEVGISYSSSSNYLHTHALIKDAEGNPLSINKTELDVVVIYATVFITLETANTNLVYLGSSNNLIQKLLNPRNVDFDSTIYLQDCPFQALGINPDDRIDSGSTTVIADVDARTRTMSCRFPITSGSGEIARIQLGTSLMQCLPESTVYNSHHQKNIFVGVGDGVKTEFTIPNRRISNLMVKLDGVQMQGYNTVIEDDYYSLPVMSRTVGSGFNMNYGQIMYKLNGVIILGMPVGGAGGAPMHFGYIDPVDGITVHGISGTLATIRDMSYAVSDDGTILRVYESYDGKSKYIKSDGVKVYNVDVPDDVTWTSISPASNSELYYEDYKSYTDNYTWYFQKLFPNAITKLQFHTAPAQDVVITADYTVPHIPKDENYVLDVSFVLQFGEGVLQ